MDGRQARSRTDRLDTADTVRHRALSWRINIQGLLFNTGFLLIALLVPLRALRLGLSAAEIGLLAAMPGVLQIPLRLASGPLVDLWGERRVLTVTFVLATGAGLLALLVPGAVLSLVLAQLAIGASRGLYWTSAQSYVSRLAGDRAGNLGRFTSFTKGGSLLGISGAGTLTVAIGFPQAFLFPALFGVACLLLTLTLPDLSDRARRQDRDVFSAFRELPRAAVRPFVVVNGIISVLCATPQALAQSFYTIYLLHLGVPAAVASMLTALQSVGMIAAGLLAGRLIRRHPRVRVLWASVILVCLSLAATWIPWVPWVSLVILTGGIAAGWLNVLFVTDVAMKSQEGNRGTNLGVTQAYFVLGMVFTPLLFGIASTHLSERVAFLMVAAAMALLGALAYRLMPWLRRRETAIDTAT